MQSLSSPENRNCTSLTSTDSIAKIARFFTKIKPTPTPNDITTQLGVHFEEVAEMLETIVANDAQSSYLLDQALMSVEAFADHLKTTEDAVRVPGSARDEFLDSVCDQVVTAVGSGHLLGMDVTAGVFEVIRSNNSKFDPVTQEPNFDENGKLLKGSAYTPPNLSGFY